MTFESDSDPILRQLAQLPVSEPDPGVSERVRSRCAAVLIKRHQRRERTTPATAGRPLLALTLVGGACLLYLSVVIGDALRLYRSS